jgi:hypothetical protein
MVTLEQLIAEAKRIPVTNEEDRLFRNKEPSKAIAMISERTGIPLSSGRVAYAPTIKCLLVVD